MENGWIDRARTVGVIHGVKEERNILHTVKRTGRKANGLVTSCVGSVF